MTIEGDNQKQADLLASALANVDPARVHGSIICFDHYTIEDNHEAFERDGTIDRSRDIDILLETDPTTGARATTPTGGRQTKRYKNILIQDVNCSAHATQPDALVHP